MGVLDINAKSSIETVEPKFKELWNITELSVGAAGENLPLFLNSDYLFIGDVQKVLWNKLLNSISNTKAPTPGNYRPLTEIKRVILAELSIPRSRYYWKSKVGLFRDKLELELRVSYGATRIPLVVVKAVRNSKVAPWQEF